MEQVKPRLLLVVPMLHQGGFERVCVRTARILRNDFEVTIAMFSDADIAYDINGLSVVNLDVPAQDGKLKKMVNVEELDARPFVDLLDKMGLPTEYCENPLPFNPPEIKSLENV